jgi:hypothetical protein
VAETADEAETTDVAETADEAETTDVAETADVAETTDVVEATDETGSTDEVEAIDRDDAVALAVSDLYTDVPYGNILPDDFRNFDFIPLYDDARRVIARCVRFSNGSYIVINNNKENPFIVEHGIHGYALIDELLTNNPDMSLVYDGPGKIRERDFEDTDEESELPAENYHTAYPDADKPDPIWREKLSKCLESVFDEDGNISEEWLQKMKLIFFVRRQYVLCLDRLPDEGGLSDWTAALNSGVRASKVIKGFFHSSEYTGHPFMESLYVMQLYMSFLNRMGEPTGVERWSTALLYGATKEQVFRGFARSREFNIYCQQNGLMP